jgi:hypothetical protein
MLERWCGRSGGGGKEKECSRPGSRLSRFSTTGNHYTQAPSAPLSSQAVAFGGVRTVKITWLSHGGHMAQAAATHWQVNLSLKLPRLCFYVGSQVPRPGDRARSCP